MPVRPPAPSVIAIALGMTIEGDLAALNKLYWQYAGTAPTNAQLATFASAVATTWNTNLAPLFPTVVSLTSVTATDLTSATAAQGTASVSLAGTSPNQIATPAQCFVIQSRIQRRYRGSHCRTYLPVCQVGGLNNNGTWTSAFITSVLSGWTAFINGVQAAIWTGGGGFQHVQVSYYSGFTNVTSSSGRARPRPTLRPAPVIDVVISHTANSKPGSQRRRTKQSA